MTNEQKLVKEFHEKFGLTINERPTIPSNKDIVLRQRLIDEETNELLVAGLISTRDVDIAEIADALGDLLYVVYGAAVTYGIDLEPVFNEIHRSNMSKLWPDGTVKKNEAGKVLKPPTYSPARLAEIIEEQKK